jgi:hypothetical protein
MNGIIWLGKRVRRPKRRLLITKNQVTFEH